MRRFVITRFDARAAKCPGTLTAKAARAFRRGNVRDADIESVSLAESPARNCDVFTHAPESRGAREYTALLEELEAAGFAR